MKLAFSASIIWQFDESAYVRRMRGDEQKSKMAEPGG